MQVRGILASSAVYAASGRARKLSSAGDDFKPEDSAQRPIGLLNTFLPDDFVQSAEAQLRNGLRAAIIAPDRALRSMNLAEGAFPSPPDRFNPIFVADTFLSPAEHALVEIPRVRGSRFIGEVYPVVSEAAAGVRIEQIRAREAKATHHCWAWRIGIGEIAERSSDDGEPSGTAGAPILRQIQGRDLTQTLVVVTRYYGGTKLGTGGLVRAYGEAASAVLDAVPIAERTLAVKVELRFAYGDTAAATSVIHRFDAEVVDQQYTEDVVITIRVRKSLTSDLSTAFMDALGGRGEVALLDD